MHARVFQMVKDKQMQSRGPDGPSLTSFCSLSRGRRECRARQRARSLVCEIKHTSVVTTVTPETPGIPRAMVLTVSFVLSPVIGRFCHRRQRNAQALRLT
jgi:hypothetical protein